MKVSAFACVTQGICKKKHINLAKLCGCSVTQRIAVNHITPYKQIGRSEVPYAKLTMDRKHVASSFQLLPYCKH